MKKLLIALMLVVATLIGPLLASAAFYTDRGDWEAAVASYMNVTLPANDLSIYQTLALPSGGGDVFNINVPLIYDSNFYYTNTISGGNYVVANGTFYNMPNSYTFNLLPVSAFGFDMVPANFAGAAGNLTINLYTLQGGVLSQTVNISDPAFFGWVGDNVTGFSTWAAGSYGLGNFVQGEGTAGVPEPMTLLLLGFGLVGLAGAKKKFRK